MYTKKEVERLIRHTEKAKSYLFELYEDEQKDEIFERYNNHYNYICDHLNLVRLELEIMEMEVQLELGSNYDKVMRWVKNEIQNN